MQACKEAVRACLVFGAATGLSVLSALSFAGSAAAVPDASCGTDNVFGLAVSASGTTSCATALQVAAAYTHHTGITTGSPVTVEAGGITWRCQEQQGDPNTSDRCVATDDANQWVSLTS
ncbi:hypothetical protein [Streptomyces chromofuscus]|uniref:hypothetical protein n=1 Tax=Streptomyces chromofuscus TaxID=42881 RepID=UPI0016771189|nr:hypothetical protein [Streptomyces chromofuscus]GGT15405.1 hypothetical protein GCM10010254_39930 [Streptomyces chromofuscus]